MNRDAQRTWRADVMHFLGR